VGRNLVGVEGITVVGNHGLELDAGANDWRARLQDFSRAVDWPVEDKGLSISLHYRRAADPVAARALLSDDLLGRRLMLSGPQSLSHAEMVATIGEVIGRPLRFQEVEPEVLKRGMIANGLSEPFVDALLARYAREVGQAAPVTGEVERILGRPARSYAQWVADHADAFRASGS